MHWLAGMIRTGVGRRRQAKRELRCNSRRNAGAGGSRSQRQSWAGRNRRPAGKGDEQRRVGNKRATESGRKSKTKARDRQEQGGREEVQQGSRCGGSPAGLHGGAVDDLGQAARRQ